MDIDSIYEVNYKSMNFVDVLNPLSYLCAPGNNFLFFYLM